jgi:uncharacterized protein (DUF427 family)
MKLPGPDHPIAILPQPGLVRVTLSGAVVAETRSALSLQEAGDLPVLYIPRADVRPDAIRRSARHSHCPYKGDATYFDLVVNEAERVDAAWSYEEPFPAVAAIRGHLAFYPGRVDAIEQT